MLLVGRQDGGGLQSLHIRSSERFRDREADEFVASQYRLDDLLLQLLGSPIHDTRKPNDHTTLQPIRVTSSGSTSNELLSDDHFVEVVEVLSSHSSGQRQAVQMLSGSHSLRKTTSESKR